MALNRNYNYRYYRPQNTSVSYRSSHYQTTQSVSPLQGFVYFFIGFFVVYMSLHFAFGSEEKDAGTMALSTSPQASVATQTMHSAPPVVAQNVVPVVQNTLGVNTEQDEQLFKLIEEKIPKDNGEYAVVVKSLEPNKGPEVYINHQTIFPAGSLYKLYVMAAALEKIEKGDMTLETVVTADANHLEQVLGSADYGYEDRRGETISYTVEQILGRISRISDNYASIMLAEKLDWEYVRDYARRMGASDTVIKSPISTTAKDTAHFFDLLYQKKIVSETASTKLLELLQTAQLIQRIPAKLPKSKLKIAHKTGELPGVRHDAGIVFIPSTSIKESTSSAKEKDKAYLIVLMSKDLKGEDSGITALADISKVVYDYLSQKK